MKKHSYVTKPTMNLRTHITDISPRGFELSDERLRLVGGGLTDQCWRASGSVTNPDHADTEQAFIVD
jgi:hypothetical protein